MKLPAGLLATWLALATGVALAEFEAPVPIPSPSEAPAELSGTLAKVRASRAVTLAYRESSVPFSYLSSRGEPIGYSIELCRKLVDAIAETVGRELEIKWLAVTPETRIDAIASGRADLECGSTTNNLERQKRVAFSPTIFVSGTTNEQAMRDLAKKFKLDFRLAVARDHAESFAQVVDGKADAFATDDVLLYGLIAQKGVRGKYAVTGEFLSYDPYGIMYRKGDTQLARVVNETFHDLAEDGEVERQYKRWFLKRLPGGASIDLPMSPQLESLVRAMATKPE